VARYRFLTTWLVDAPIEAVWEAIHGIERWPGIRRVTKVRENVYAWRGRIRVGPRRRGTTT
jgi:carbon monoxide dehydrogenase subunit G